MTCGLSAFRSLSCQRITLHKNLFLSFILNSIITVVWLTTMVNKDGHIYNYSVSQSDRSSQICPTFMKRGGSHGVFLAGQL